MAVLLYVYVWIKRSPYYSEKLDVWVQIMWIVGDSWDRPQWCNDSIIFGKLDLSVMDQTSWNTGRNSYEPIQKALSNLSQSHKAIRCLNKLSLPDISSLFPKENRVLKYPATFKTASLRVFFPYFFWPYNCSQIRTKRPTSQYGQSHALSFLKCVSVLTF